VTATATREHLARSRVRPFAAEYPFEPHFVEVDGGTMHYVDEGPRDGEVLLFLHGNPTWSFLWRNLIRALSQRYRCIAPDHIGCGLSDKPQDWGYRLAQHIDNVAHLVEQLGIQRLTLVVHDWGGAIGFGLAERKPARIARAVVMNTAAFTGLRAPLRIRACRIPGFGTVAVRGFNAFARAATFMATERGLSPLARKGLLAPYSNWAERIATLRFVEDIPLSAAHPSHPTLLRIEGGLSGLRDIPMCLIWGERDWCFTPEFRREWERRFPGAESHKFVQAGHWVTEDAPTEVLALVESFLRKHSVAP
jgi:pimeloyl-ACP methyl ester carboxylesterase